MIKYSGPVTGKERDARYIDAVVPEITDRYQVKYGNRNINTSVLGSTPNYLGVHGFEMVAGRMTTRADDSARKRVAVLAAAVPGMLDTDAAGIIGRNISIRSIPFEVIGVLKAKGSTGWRNPDDDAWIPLSTAKPRAG